MFQDAQLGVTAVTGVILIVAVTVATSAGIGLYLDRYADQGLDGTPAVSWLKDDSADALSLVAAPPGLLWSEYELLVSHEVRVALDAAADMAATPLVPGQPTTIGAGELTADQVLRFCGAVDSAPADHEDVVVQLRHVPAGRLAHTFAFVDVAAC